VHLNWEANLLLYKEEFQKIGVEIPATTDLLKSRSEYVKEKQQRIQSEEKVLPCRGLDSEESNHKHHRDESAEAKKKKKNRFIKFVVASSLD
jgi:hypothetical protein